MLSGRGYWRITIAAGSDGVQDTVPKTDSGADRFFGGGLSLKNLIFVIPAQGFQQP